MTFEERQMLPEQAGQHKAPRGPELYPKSRVQKSGTQDGHKCWGPYTDASAHTHPPWLSPGFLPLLLILSQFAAAIGPREVQLQGPDRANGAPSSRDMPASPGRPTPRVPVPTLLGPPESGALHLPAESSRAQFEARVAEPRGGAERRLVGPPLPARPTALQTSYRRVWVRAAAPPAPSPRALPAGQRLCRPARFPPRAAPTLPFAPPFVPRLVLSQPANGPPQKPCAAASLFGSWPFFNSQHTERIKLELGAAAWLPGGSLVGGGGMDWGSGVASSLALGSLRSCCPLGRPLVEQEMSWVLGDASPRGLLGTLGASLSDPKSLLLLFLPATITALSL